MKTFWQRLQPVFVCLFLLGLFLAVTGRPAAAGMLTMETPHFNIHFREYPGAEEVAAKVAAIAEEIHAVLIERIGYTPAKRTEIYLMDTTDFANGFADVTYFNRIGIYLVYPDLDAEWTGGLTMKAEDWLRLVLTHEYAHILQLDMNGGITAAIRRVFGRIPLLATPNVLLPLAYLEGFAVYEETANTGGGRGTDPYFDMYLRTAVLTDTVPTFSQMLGAYDLDEWQPAGTVYLYGWSLVDYIAREYGEEALRKANESHGSLLRLGLFDALARTLGKPAWVLWKEWRRDLEERYRAQAAEVEAAGLTPVEELTGPIMAAAPVFSPDGRSLAYITLGKKTFYPGLYLRDLASGKDRLLVAGYISSRPAWSPSGRQLVYAKPGYLDGERFYNDLYLYDLDQKEEIRLTWGARATDPAWAPSGDYLVYVARDNLETALCRYNLATGESLVLLPGGGEIQYAAPAFSPDGTELTVGVWYPGGEHGIALLKNDGFGFRLLLSDRSNNRSPVFTADGKYILFASDRDGTHNIYAFAPDTGALWKLTNTLTGFFAPAPAPDSQELVMMAYGAGGYRLARANWADLLWEEVAVAFETPAKNEAPGETLSTPVEGSTRQQAAGYRVKPYNPWETLKPKYWLPVLGVDTRGGLRLGFETSGLDASERHGYQIRLAHGLKSGESEISLGYWYDPPGRLYLDLVLDAITRESIEGGGRQDRFGFGATAGLWYPGMQASRDLFTGVYLETTKPAPPVTGTEWTGQVYAGVWEETKGGKGPSGYCRERELTAGFCFTGEENGFFGEGFWKYSRIRRGVPRTTWKISAGLSQLPGYFELGGAPGGHWKSIFTGYPYESHYTVRGFDSGTVAGSGFLLLNAETYPLRIPVEKGLWDWPVFFRQVRGGVFLDTGYAADSWEFTESGLIAAGGVEIRLTMDFLYQPNTWDFRFGFAWPLYPRGQDETRAFRIYVGMGSEF